MTLHARLSASPADALRARVVTLVLSGIIGLAFGLYALIGALLVTRTSEAVPDALWLAAGGFGGALITLLANSKGGPEGGVPGPVPVTTAPGEALAVRRADEPARALPFQRHDPDAA